MSTLTGQQAMQTVGVAVLKCYDTQTPYLLHSIKPYVHARAAAVETKLKILAFECEFGIQQRLPIEFFNLGKGCVKQSVENGRGVKLNYRDSIGWKDSPIKRLMNVHRLEPVNKRR